MTSLPNASPSQHAVYTGRTTSWAMVATTCVSAVLIVLMGKGAKGSWGDILFVIPLILVAGIFLSVEYAWFFSGVSTLS